MGIYITIYTAIDYRTSINYTGGANGRIISSTIWEELSPEENSQWILYIFSFQYKYIFVNSIRVGFWSFFYISAFEIFIPVKKGHISSIFDFQSKWPFIGYVFKCWWVIPNVDSFSCKGNCWTQTIRWKT